MMIEKATAAEVFFADDHRDDADTFSEALRNIGAVINAALLLMARLCSISRNILPTGFSPNPKKFLFKIMGSLDSLKQTYEWKLIAPMA